MNTGFESVAKLQAAQSHKQIEIEYLDVCGVSDRFEKAIADANKRIPAYPPAAPGSPMAIALHERDIAIQRRDEILQVSRLDLRTIKARLAKELSNSALLVASLNMLDSTNSS